MEGLPQQLEELRGRYIQACENNGDYEQVEREVVRLVANCLFAEKSNGHSNNGSTVLQVYATHYGDPLESYRNESHPHWWRVSSRCRDSARNVFGHAQNYYKTRRHPSESLGIGGE